MHKLVFGTFALLVSVTAVAGSADAESGSYRATFVEIKSGPNQPSPCSPGTSCGSVAMPGIGTGISTITFARVVSARPPATSGSSRSPTVRP